MDDPKYFWNPTFNPENMFFYTGAKFPRLKGSLIVAGASKKIIPMSVQAYITLGRAIRLEELNVRFRDIRQGPDGNIYVLTEGRLRGPRDTDGMLLRLEPVAPAGAADRARGSTSPDR